MIKYLKEIKEEPFMSSDEKITIRTARESDAPALLAIYAPYVENTAITFEYDVPSIEEFTSRIHHTLEKYPYLVAEKTARSLAMPTPARSTSVPLTTGLQTSIYVDQNCKHMGIGRLLHDALEQTLKAQGILNMNACIAYTPSADAHLDNNSVEFHSHMGYRLVGEFYQCGYKFDTWYNMVWMEKQIGEHHKKQPAPIAFKEFHK